MCVLCVYIYCMCVCGVEKQRKEKRFPPTQNDLIKFEFQI
jgi:hypothetical protein